MILKGTVVGDVFSKQPEHHAAPAAVFNRATGNANQGGSAILAFPFRCQPLEWFGGTKKVGQSKPLIVIGVEAKNMLPKQCVGGSVSQQRSKGGIRVENQPLGITTADAIWCVRHQGPEIQLRATQVFLRRPQRGTEGWGGAQERCGVEGELLA